jgi:membrane protein implicated in regulation of membrane protease activity
MNWPDLFLLCFAVGSLWALASLLLGGLHLGHIGGHGHGLGHMHGHLGHPAGTCPGQGGHPVGPNKIAKSLTEGSWLGSMANPSCMAVFLAWFGGVGYLLTRHSGLAFWLDLAFAVALGLAAAWILAAFLRFLQSRERPLDPSDYEMVGVLGQVSCTIRPDGVGEMLYVREGTRRSASVCSADGQEIKRGEEVVVTRYEKGIAYVRTWEAMTQTGNDARHPEALHKEMKHVE